MSTPSTDRPLPSTSRKGPAFLRDHGSGEYYLVLIAAVLALFAVFVLSLSIGRYHIPFSDTLHIFFENIFRLEPLDDPIATATIWTLRFPRTLTAVIVGAALALSGSAYQSIFKNPMCSPDLLGVSSGACIGAAIAILMGGSSWLIQVLAFVFGVIAVGITLTIPRLMRSQSTTVLILSGIVVGSLMSSIMSIIKVMADTDSELAEITYWTMGSFAAVTLDKLLPVLPSILIPMVIILLMRYRLNVLSLGDNESRTLGVNLQVIRTVFILCSTLMTAGCVCVSGTIGWVGLVIPHTARMIIGADNKKMLPVAMAFGGIFMLIIDILARTLSASELRLGILTGIIGAPFFIFLLFKQHRSLT